MDGEGASHDACRGTCKLNPEIRTHDFVGDREGRELPGRDDDGRVEVEDD